jgi:hypothetical protein
MTEEYTFLPNTSYFRESRTDFLGIGGMKTWLGYREFLQPATTNLTPQNFPISAISQRKIEITYIFV